jgi:aspartate kinase
MDVPARSWQGWQVPINTTSAAFGPLRRRSRATNIDAKFAEGMRVAVVAGFPGRRPRAASPRLAAAGRTPPPWPLPPPSRPNAAISIPMSTASIPPIPRITSKARKLEKIAFEEMLELASLGAKVLQTRSVELAMRYKVRLRVLSSFEDTDENSGTLVCDEDEIMESKVVSGVAYSRDEAKMTLVTVEDRPGIAAAIFGPLAEAG